MVQSVRAVLWGIFLALGIGAIVVFAAAFAFYYGGMIAAYKAPYRRRLHGVIVGVTSFAVSPLLNLGASALATNTNDPFVNLRTPGAMLITGVLFVVVLAASYVGARRGESLHAHNEKVTRDLERRRSSREGAGS